MGRIQIVKQGITKLDVDCIVNAANEELWAGGGVCGAIFKEAGYEQLERACREIGHCDTGSAVITPGFNLKAEYIIHAVGPRWSGGNHGESGLLQRCYKAAIMLAQENGCTTIGFPLISSGIYGYPKKEAWEVALKAVKEVQDDMDVYFAVLDDDMLELGNSVYKALFDDSDEAILRAIDREKLQAGIDVLCKIRKIEWTPAKEDKGVLTFAYPIYPQELFCVFDILEPDYNYTENISAWKEQPIASEMTAGQIKTMLTWIERGERFCDGNIAGEVDSGRLLKLLLRLDDLLVKYQKG